MKNIIQFSFLAITLFMFSCSDACDDVDCGANGSCDDGICICVDGYEGTNCETEIRTKYLGTYNGNFSECLDELGLGATIPTEFATVSAQVTADPADVNKVILAIPNPLLMIESISLEAGGSFTIPATTVTIPNVPLPVTVSGQGMFIDENNLEVNLQIVIPLLASIDCQILMTK